MLFLMYIIIRIIVSLILDKYIIVCVIELISIPAIICFTCKTIQSQSALSIEDVKSFIDNIVSLVVDKNPVSYDVQ